MFAIIKIRTNVLGGVNMKKSLKIKSLLVTAVFIVIIMAVIGINAKGSSEIRYKMVVVQPGDTVWSIAKKSIKKGQDIREAVYHIRRENNLQSLIIVPGQSLSVPDNY